MVEEIPQLVSTGVARRCESTPKLSAEADDQDDDETPGPLQKIRASICEIAELFAQKYSEVFTQLDVFVEGVWNMLSSVGPGIREDVVSSLQILPSGS